MTAETQEINYAAEVLTDLLNMVDDETLLEIIQQPGNMSKLSGVRNPSQNIQTIVANANPFDIIFINNSSIETQKAVVNLNPRAILLCKNACEEVQVIALNSNDFKKYTPNYVDAFSSLPTASPLILNEILRFANSRQMEKIKAHKNFKSLASLLHEKLSDNMIK